ncbi:MAG: hypothetical protein UZ21_OP11001000315 [Microgenomates bacterium OLB22]|nr:MAG: hypothetical protein UZ21_OP11001000315 [Microgenomates bacterium OLB22]
MSDLKRKNEEWKKRFKDALAKWWRVNGYKFASVLRDELGIDDNVWSHMAAGTSIGPTEYYARIYARSGTTLKESDPTTIPDRPRAGGTSIPLAWSQDELEEYLAGPGRKYLPKGSAQSVAPMSRSEVVAPVAQGTQTIAASVFGNIGLGMDAVMQQVIEIAADRIAQRLASNPYQGVDISALAAAVATEVGKKQQRDAVSMTMMLSMLTNLLDLAMTSSPEQRDELVKEHGRAFGRIIRMLNTLTKPRDQREAELDLPQEL